MSAASLSYARLGEILAHAHHYPEATLAAVVDALGYSAAIVAAVERGKRALAIALEQGDVAPMRSFVRAYDVVLHRLKVRKPPLSAARRTTKLEPQRDVAPGARDPSLVPEVVAAAPIAASPPGAAHVVPSYLQGERPGRSEPPPGPRPAAEPAFVLNIGVPGAGGPRVETKPSVATTGSVDTGRIIAGLKLPFDKRPDVKPPDADSAARPATQAESALETFARLTVALASHEPRASVLQRFGLTDESRSSLSTHWGERIAADPGLRAAFDDLVRKHRSRA